MIFIENEQDLFEITKEIEEIIEKVSTKVLEYEGVDEKTDINVLLVDNETIREINNEQRNIDSETDVLSFPMLDFVNGEMLAGEADYFEGSLILGDIVLSLQKAQTQSIEYGHSFIREVGFLVCHSMFHLLGYDHIIEEDRVVMREKEEAVLTLLGLTRE